MIESFIKSVIMVAISAFLAVFIVKIFDDWYQNCEQRRAIKREHRNQNHHNRYE